MFRNLLNLLRLAGGIILLLIGIISLFLPFLQGVLLIAIAIPLISPKHGRMASDKIKSWYAKWKQRKMHARESKEIN